ncbi:MAG: hypothetical protein ACREBS_01770 [Nitrososphaerales archaeon]
MSQMKNRDLVFSGARLAFLVTMGVIFLGGAADWAYLNVQEYSISIYDAFVEYLTSYASAFLISGIEIAAAYYFMERYDLGVSGKKIIYWSLVAGGIGFLGYVLGEVIAGLSTITVTGEVSILEPIYYELTPVDLDYGNALIIMLTIFSLVMLIWLLLKINPMPKNMKAGLSKGTGVMGGLWTSTVTTLAATVCCGPLPGAIALATGISSIYFTAIIQIQSLIILVSVPLLLSAIYLADKRARKGCKLKYSSHKSMDSRVSESGST